MHFKILKLFHLNYQTKKMCHKSTATSLQQRNKKLYQWQSKYRIHNLFQGPTSNAVALLTPPNEQIDQIPDEYDVDLMALLADTEINEMQVPQDNIPVPTSKQTQCFSPITIRSTSTDPEIFLHLTTVTLVQLISILSKNEVTLFIKCQTSQTI